jgi:hypothetical protein
MHIVIGFVKHTRLSTAAERFNAHGTDARKNISNAGFRQQMIQAVKNDLANTIRIRSSGFVGRRLQQATTKLTGNNP